MGHKERGYKRDTPVELVRDYKLFAIACEGGKREPGYFNVFQHLSRKIKVDVIENYVTDDEMFKRYETNSAPKWVLDRAVRYIEKNDLKDEDDLWFVIDKDRWTEAQIRELGSYCDKYPNWHLVISNPCFEIWLYFHKKADIKSSGSISCADFKKEISTSVFLSLMSQYTPVAKVRHHPSLKRRITKNEYEQVTDYALKLGFDNIFVQEVNDTELTPDFDLDNPFD